MPSKRKHSKTGNKEQILKSATELFIEKGYHATSTTDICKAADINRPTLYWYFKDKRHLFFSCHMEGIENRLKPYLKQAKGIADPLERLSFMVREFTKKVCLEPELRVLLHETLGLKDEYSELVEAEWKEHYLLLKSTIQELQSKGLVSSDLKTSWSALLLLGMMAWVSFWFDHSRPEHIGEIAETANELAFKGLLLKPDREKS